MSSHAGIRLIVGLGNPGAEYESTRHNAGAWFVEALCSLNSIALKTDNKLFSRVGKLPGTTDCRLMIPSTYMNESGKSVLAVAQYFKIQPHEILVAHDELDFPVGNIKIKQGGGHWGHNGLRDIIRCLGNKDFYRLRIGINHPGHKDRVTGHVLNKPSAADRTQIDDAISQAVSIVPLLCEGKYQRATNQLHSD